MRAVVRVAPLDIPSMIDRRFQAKCETGECDWSYTNVARVAVEEEARWHRQHHRRQAAADLEIDE